MKILHSTMVLNVLLAATLPFVVLACPPPKDPDVPSTDGGPYTCPAACGRARSLHCELGEPTRRGATCEAVCANVQKENGGVGFNVQCVVEAKTCSAMDECR